MKIFKFPSREEAEKELIPEDVPHAFERHTLDCLEEVKLHVEKVRELIFISEGKFTITIGSRRSKCIELAQELRGSEVIVLDIPAGERHALKADSFLSYVVFKEVK